MEDNRQNQILLDELVIEDMRADLEAELRGECEEYYYEDLLG